MLLSILANSHSCRINSQIIAVSMSESLGFKNTEIKRKYAQFNWMPSCKKHCPGFLKITSLKREKCMASLLRSYCKGQVE